VQSNQLKLLQSKELISCWKLWDAL